MAMPDLNQATREIMWNIPQAWLMYTLFLISLAVMGYGIYLRVQAWKKGKPDGDRLSDWVKRGWFLIRELLFQTRVRNRFFPSIFHSLIYYSFIVLVITTAVVALDYDFGTTFFRGYVYVLLTVGSELGGVLILVGVTLALYRRLVTKPKWLETSLGDIWALAFLAILVLTGFLVEGLRIAVKGDPWALLSAVGLGFSYLFTGTSESTGLILHKVFWWIHAVAAFAWIATLPYTKFFHLMAVPGNNMLQKTRPMGELPRQDLEVMMSADDFDEDKFNVGIAKTSDFTWKQRFDTDACIECGRCNEQCPSNRANEPFGPKELILGSRRVLQEGVSAMGKWARRPEEGKPEKADEKELAAQDPEVVGKAFDENFIWFCRTCGACMEVCPASIDHVDLLMEVRRNQILMQSEVPTEGGKAIRTMENLGNPFGAQADRTDWIKQTGVRVVGKGEKVDVLYWIGCCTTFDPQKHYIAEGLFRLMEKAGVDFGVLGSAERCCGDPARLFGQEMLFQEAAKKQIEELKARTFNTLLVSCPHCLNVFKNEYPQFACNLPVKHHSQLLAELIQEGKLLPQVECKGKVVYHDPCFLGRYQGIFDPPREVLGKIPGLQAGEMKDNRNRSLCCGGGGGHYWMDLKAGERINNIRVAQAGKAGADTIVTGCPYCLQMLQDSVKGLDLDEKIRCQDLVAMLEHSTGKPGGKEGADPAPPGR